MFNHIVMIFISISPYFKAIFQDHFLKPTSFLSFIHDLQGHRKPVQKTQFCKCQISHVEPTHLNTNLESKIKEDGGLTESVEHQTNIFFWNSDCSKVESRQNCYQTKCLTVFLWLYFLGSCLAEVSFTSHSFGVYKILGDGGVSIYLTYPFPQNFRYYHREDIYSGSFIF